jgi:hypothetical protein
MLTYSQTTRKHFNKLSGILNLFYQDVVLLVCKEAPMYLISASKEQRRRQQTKKTERARAIDLENSPWSECQSRVCQAFEGHFWKIPVERHV